MSVPCIKCARAIEVDRLAVLPDTTYCAGCARMINPQRVKGAMTWEHKTAPVICVMSADHYNSDWKKYNPSFGRGSGVHKMSPSHKIN